jgi:hypothetical protein
MSFLARPRSLLNCKYPDSDQREKSHKLNPIRRTVVVVVAVVLGRVVQVSSGDFGLWNRDKAGSVDF